MKAELILIPRLEKKWVHFDYLIKIQDFYFFRRSEASVYTNPLYPSFYAHLAPDYIVSDNKKNYRKRGETFFILPDSIDKNKFNDILLCQFDNSFYNDDLKIRCTGWDRGEYLKKLGMSWEDARIPLEIESVKVLNQVYICPSSGIVWQPRKPTNAYTDRHWSFKKLPKWGTFDIVYEQETDAYFIKNGKNKSKSAFFSGEKVMELLNHTADKTQWKKFDPRLFLYSRKKRGKLV
jgi:hypothetical protein